MIKIYIEPRDLWIGVYISLEAVYVCILPMIVIRFWRHWHGRTR